MRLTVLLFAQLADAVGARSIQIDLPDGATVAQAIDALAASHSSIAVMRDRIAVAVDERYVPPTTGLSQGQVMALIPPVSGG